MPTRVQHQNQFIFSRHIKRQNSSVPKCWQFISERKRRRTRWRLWRSQRLSLRSRSFDFTAEGTLYSSWPDLPAPIQPTLIKYNMQFDVYILVFKDLDKTEVEGKWTDSQYKPSVLEWVLKIEGQRKKENPVKTANISSGATCSFEIDSLGGVRGHSSCAIQLYLLGKTRAKHARRFHICCDAAFFARTQLINTFKCVLPWEISVKEGHWQPSSPQPSHTHTHAHTLNTHTEHTHILAFMYL